MEKKSITIRDIAKAAGVSPATVSLVLNKKGGVGDARRRLIQQLLDEHEYTPKKPVRETLEVLLVKYIRYRTIIEHNGDFINRVMGGLEAEADALKIKLTTRNASSHDFADLPKLFASGEFHGVIALGTELDNAFAHELTRSPIPVLVLDNIVEGFDMDAVVMDNQGGVHAAVSHLAEKGHRHIGFIRSRLDISNFRLRYEGYRRALAGHDLPFNPEWLFDVEPTMYGAYRDISGQLAAGRTLPTAFFASNDSMGVGLLKALKRHDSTLPERISVIGFDDLSFCTVSEPTLTTMAVPKEAMGRLAARRIREMLADDSRRECVKFMVFPRLVERESVREPR